MPTASRSLYAPTCEELYEKEQDARQQVQDILFRRRNPTVAEYCEKRLLVRSAAATKVILRNIPEQTDLLLQTELIYATL